MSDDRKVFLVMGDCGDYAEARDWPVRVFEDRADADALVERLAAWCDERGIWHERVTSDGYMRWSVDCLKPDEDPLFSTDLTTGTRYVVADVPFTAARARGPA